MLGLQVVEVLANGHWRHAKVRGERLRVLRSILLEQIDQRLSGLRLFHLCSWGVLSHVLFINFFLYKVKRMWYILYRVYFRK